MVESPGSPWPCGNVARAVSLGGHLTERFPPRHDHRLFYIVPARHEKKKLYLVETHAVPMIEPLHSLDTFIVDKGAIGALIDYPIGVIPIFDHRVLAADAFIRNNNPAGSRCPPNQRGFTGDIKYILVLDTLPAPLSIPQVKQGLGRTALRLPEQVLLLLVGLGHSIHQQ